MKTNEGFKRLEKLFLSGNYHKFMDEFHKLPSPVNEDLLFFAVGVAHHQADWNYVQELLKFLKESSSPENRIRAGLSQLFFEFISGNANRSQAKTIFDLCDGIIEKEPPFSRIVFFAKETKIKVQCALLSQGLLDARKKQMVLKEGFSICKQFKKSATSESEVLFRLLLKQMAQSPMSNFREAFELNEKTLQEKEFKSDLQRVPFYLNKIKFWLKLKYHKRTYDSKVLPGFVIEILAVLEKMSFDPAKAIVYMIYGGHLKDLECIESIDWFKKAIPLLLKYGHYQDAETSYKNCVRWLENRGQHLVLENFMQKVKFSPNENKLPILKDFVYLNQAHAFFEKGDYLNVIKLLKEKSALLSNEINKFSFTNLIVNSAAKLSLEPTAQIRLIDESIDSLVPIKYSVLVAQLIAFRATIDSEFSESDYKKTIHLYHELGMFEEEVIQRINLSFLMLSKQKKKKAPIITEQLLAYFKEIKQLIEADIWFKNKSSLKGNLYQMYAHALFENREIEKSIEFVDIAHDFMIDAANFKAAAFNSERKSNLLIEMGRSTNDFSYYEDAQKISLNALEFMEKEMMPDFIWRYQFSLARSYCEPFQRKIVPIDRISESRRAAVKYFYGAVHTYGTIIRKNALQGTFKNLEAIIKLKKEVTQLIFSGFYFFLLDGKYEDCIHWLELVRVKGLLSALAKGLKPSVALKEHPLVVKETQLGSSLNNCLSTAKENELRLELSALYEDMMTDTLTSNYAKRKREIIPSFDEFRESIIAEERKLKDRNLFFLYYYAHKNDMYALGIGSKYEKPQITKIALSANEIKNSLKTFRMKMASFSKLNLKLNVHFWTQFSALIEPIKNWTNIGDVICVVPYGFLQNLPFHALHLDGLPLIFRNPIFYNTSLTTWEYLRHRSNSKNIMSAPEIFGDPEGNLRKSVEEVKAVSDLFEVEAKIGKMATKSNFLKALNSTSFIHFAGHGVFDSAKGFQSSIRFFNGELLSAEEIMKQTNIAEFIVLASCDTALQKNYAGEELAGLTAAFLGAGAKTVMAGMWPVADEDAKEYFFIFYHKIKQGISKVIANQETMIELMQRENKTHFYHWGMFAITGYWQ